MNKPATFATNEFPWEELSHDDFICTIMPYVFRVEKMDEGHWWWCVCFRGESINFDNQYSISKYRAIGNCEGLFMGHKTIVK